MRRRIFPLEASAPAEPFWLRGLIADATESPDAFESDAHWAAEVDRAARAAGCLGDFSGAGLFGAAAALFAASPERAFGLAPSRDEPPALARAMASVFGSSEARGLFSGRGRRWLLAQAIRFWRAGRAAGRRASVSEHLLIAHALFQEQTWDDPPAAGQWSDALGPKRGPWRAGRSPSWLDGPRYACSNFLRLWLEDAKDAGGEALLGDILSLFFARSGVRNRWNDRAWALLGPECAGVLPWRLSIPVPDSASAHMQFGPAERERLELAGPNARREPLFLALASRPRWSMLWDQAALWRKEELGAMSPIEADVLARKILDDRLRARLMGDSMERALSEREGSLFLLSRVCSLFPAIAGERPEGSFLWQWADCAPEGPSAGPIPKRPRSPSGREDDEDESTNHDDEWDRTPEGRARAGLRAFIGLGEWLQSLGPSPLRPGPDGRTPLDKIRSVTGYGEIAAEWERLALLGETGSDPARQGSARRATRI